MLLRSKIACAALLGSTCLTAPALAFAAADAAPAASDQPVITVTATRETTNIQKTSVQVSAFNAQKLTDASATQMGDITYLVPSVRFTSNSSAVVSYIAIRGVSVPPIGTAGQGTTVYEEEIPLAGPALNTTTYDLKDIQVLQGPQGTLFGRNTLAGAILIEPQLPAFTQDGYLKAGYGNFNAWTIEGAGNATVIPDVLAVRIAGQIQRHDAMFPSLSPALSGQDTQADEGFRLSVLFTPTTKLRNVTTFEYSHENDTPNPEQVNDPVSIFNGNKEQTSLFSVLSAQYILGFGTPAATAAFFGYPATVAGYNSLLAGAEAAVACKHRCVFYGLIPDSEIYVHQDNYRVFNTTTFDISPNVELKNIFGFQDTSLILGENSSGGPSPALLAQQFSSGSSPSQSITEEFQVRGNALDNRVNGVLGFYYEHDYEAPNAPSGLLTPFGSPSAADNQSKAVYGNVNVGIIGGLKFNGGFRYTWDSQRNCSLGSTGTTSLPTASQCFAIASNSMALGSGIISQSAAAPTWSVGLDWQATDHLFFYVKSRRGYRSGGVNTPLYNEPCLNGALSNYTAGQAGSATPTGSGTCPDFGLASTAGAKASGKSIDLSSTQFLKPETLTDVEVGMRSDWNIGGWRERLNLTYFHYWYNNVLSQVGWGKPAASPYFGYPDGNPLYPALAGTAADPTFGAAAVNVGNIVADGFDADLAVNPTRDLSLDFAFSYLNQKATETVPAAIAAQIPAGYPSTVVADAIQQFTSPTSPYSFTVTARYVLPWHPLNGDLAINYNYFWTSSYHGQNIAIPGYDLHNLRLDWNHIGGSNISAGFWVKNLTDNTYIQAVEAGAGLDSFLYSEPRTFGADVTVKFH